MNHHNKLRALLLIACTSWNIISLQLAFAAPPTPDTTAATGNSAGHRSSCASSSSSTPAPATSIIVTDDDDPHRLARQRIQSGRVYVHPNFLSSDQLQLLQNDRKKLEHDGKFIVNGLSDVRKGLKGEVTTTTNMSSSSSSSNGNNKANQGFDVKYDRSVCPIPWWKDALSLSTEEEASDDYGCSLSDNADDDEEKKLLHSIQIKLQRLRQDLSHILERPTMMNNDLGHECYYSQSTPGSSLARHLDERHEETKGRRGWLLPSRRSLSWLIYLSETTDDDAHATTSTSTDDDGVVDGDDRNSSAWNANINGGLLRTFPQKWYRNTLNDGSSWEDTVECGSHNGNLQVGWLVAKDDEDGMDSGSNNDDHGEKRLTHPVFLDSWFDHINPHTGAAEPHCILYIVRKPPKENDNGGIMRIEYISVPWSIDAIGGNVADFIQQRARLESVVSSNDDDSSPSLFLQLDYAQQFQLVEDREAWMRGETPAGTIAEDFVPTRGTLVVFDSVTLPHEVTAVVMGRRAALAGWFHEETQPLGGGIE